MMVAAARIVASASLLLLSCWDLFDGAGRMDFIVMGLAGYELVIGFTEEGGRGRATPFNNPSATTE